jgi:L-amino acid N-acyltransferase YncA
MLKIREVSLQDLDIITRIYNDAVTRTSATFDTEPKNQQEQSEWFNAHSGRHKILVAEVDLEVIGWASLSKWSDRCAYSDTAECSLYIDERYRDQGTGRQLMDALLKTARESGFHTLIARIVEGNDASIHLCESLGFRHIGLMKEVGRKSGRLLDVILLQIMLE